MKNLKIITIILISLIVLSCKKDDPAPSISFKVGNYWIPEVTTLEPVPVILLDTPCEPEDTQFSYSYYDTGAGRVITQQVVGEKKKLNNGSWIVYKKIGDQQVPYCKQGSEQKDCSGMKVTYSTNVNGKHCQSDQPLVGQPCNP